MSALQKWLITGACIAVASISVLAAGISIAAGLHDKPTAPAPVDSGVHLAVPHASSPIATLIHWDVAHGPDPFALPRRSKGITPSTPLRKRLHVDASFLGRYRPMPVIPEIPDRPSIDTYPSKIRMAGFFSGNGVYAVLQTTDQTVVVNPGDRLVDGGRVTEIRPRDTKLEQGDRTYDIDMGESL